MKDYVILLALFLAPFVVFFPALHYDYVSFDDGLHVYHNPRLNPPTWESVKAYWQAPYKGLYVPLTYSVWSLGALVSPKELRGKYVPTISPGFFHLINLTFHGANTALLFLLLTALSFPVLAAVLACLFFAWHPLQVEPVAWISALKDLLCGFFSLLALWQYVRAYGKVSNRKAGVFSAVAYVLALLAKPSAIVVPLLAGLIDRTLLGRPWRENIKAWAPGLVIGLPFCLMTKYLQPDITIGFVPSYSQRLVVALDTCVFYLGKLVFPFLLTVNYGRTPQMVLKEPLTAWLWIVPLVLGFFIWKRRDLKYVWLGLGLFLIAPLPVLGLVPFYYQKYSTVADRYLYLGLLGPAIVVAAFAARGGKSRIALVSIGLLFLAVRSFDQLGMWENNRTLIHQMGKLNPRDADVHYGLAVVLSEESQLPGQATFYSEMLRLPVEERTEEARLERQKEAIFHYREAIRINPDYAHAHNNLGMLFHRMENFADAEKHFREAIRIEPKMGQAYNNLGATLAREGKFKEALKAFEEADRTYPDDENVRRNLSRVRALLKKGGKG